MISMKNAIRRSDVLRLTSGRDESGDPLAQAYRVVYDDGTYTDIIVPGTPSDEGWYRIETDYHPWQAVQQCYCESASEMASHLADVGECRVTRITSLEIQDDERRPRVYSDSSTVYDEQGVSRVVTVVTDGADYHHDWATMSAAERDTADAWTAAEHEERCAHLP